MTPHRTNRFTIVAAAFLAITTRTPAAPDPTPPPDAPTEVAPADAVSRRTLDRAIDGTLEHPRYAWRAPRERPKPAEEPHGILHDFLLKIGRQLKAWAEYLAEIGRRFAEWLRAVFSNQEHTARRPGLTNFSVRALWTVAVLACVGLLAYCVYYVASGRRRMARTLTPQTAVLPDILDEDVTADALPADEWLAMAADFMQREEWRLAMRAMFLAALAHLGREGRVVIARYKSNREYTRELDRRAHNIPGLVHAFGSAVGLFERVWYGDHTADRDTIEAFAATQAAIVNARTPAAPAMPVAPPAPPAEPTREAEDA